MIHAYAIDPEVPAKWTNIKDYRMFVNEFGLGCKRVLLEYPKKWAKNAYSSVSAGALTDMERKRLETLIQKISSSKVRRNNWVYSQELTWLENACSEKNRCDFKGILAFLSDLQNGVMNIDDLGIVLSPIWELPGNKTILRNSDSLFSVIEPILQNASRVSIVDPYFSLSSGNWAYADIFRKIITSASQSEPFVSEFHIHVKDEQSLAQYQCSLNAKLREYPRGVRISMHIWKPKAGGDALHNRFLLTDIGGVSLGWGLGTGKQGEMDEVSLLSLEQYTFRSEQFRVGSTHFNLVDSFCVNT